jgi:hypothetical protein
MVIYYYKLLMITELLDQEMSINRFVFLIITHKSPLICIIFSKVRLRTNQEKNRHRTG